MPISIFGWLDKINFWRDLPYPIKGALLRAMKAALAGFIGVLLAAATAGTLFPSGSSALIVLIVTAILQALDKYLRELVIEREMDKEPPDTDNPTG